MTLKASRYGRLDKDSMAHEFHLGKIKNAHVILQAVLLPEFKVPVSQRFKDAILGASNGFDARLQRCSEGGSQVHKALPKGGHRNSGKAVSKRIDGQSAVRRE
jgi:hypothetical protein